MIRQHSRNGITVAEVTDKGVIIKDAQDFLDIATGLPARKIILKKEHLCERFFDLKTGIAGDILQKVSNYQLSLGIVGDFSVITSKSLKDFIYESNRNKQVLFMNTVDEVLNVFCGGR